MEATSNGAHSDKTSLAQASEELLDLHKILHAKEEKMRARIAELQKLAAYYDILNGKKPLAYQVFLGAHRLAANGIGSAKVGFSNDVIIAPDVLVIEPPPGKAQEITEMRQEKAEKQQQAVEEAGDASTTTPSVVTSGDQPSDKSAAHAHPPHGILPLAAPKDAAGERVDFSRLDVRVGLIDEVENHPDAESLFVEKISVGEDKPRTIISGLRKFCTIEQLHKRPVVVICNLKPAKMRGILSEGMVLCASTPDAVEPLMPPEGSQPGDRVECQGYHEFQPDAQLNPKKKIWEQVQPDFYVSADEGVAKYRDAVWEVKGKGVVVAPTMRNCTIK